MKKGVSVLLALIIFICGNFGLQIEAQAALNLTPIALNYTVKPAGALLRERAVILFSIWEMVTKSQNLSWHLHRVLWFTWANGRIV